MNDTETQMIAVLNKLAIEAGAVIMLTRAQGVNAREKEDKSPVTEADERAEKIILDGLANHFPHIPVVAEEAAAAGRLPTELGHLFFLVDPLDGTKEFVAGRQDFTVNIALIENGIPICGVVYAPAHNIIYSAGRNSATKARVEAEIIMKPTRLRSADFGQVDYCGPTRVVASRSHMNAETETFLAATPNCQTVNIGSSLKFCILADGAADIYPRFGRTMEWDTAAGDAILRAVGGTTNTSGGAPLIYGKRNQVNDTDFANPYFIATAAFVVRIN